MECDPHEEAWERYLRAERKELRMRQEGHLAKLLDGPLPDETPEEIARMAEEDRLRALEGLVEVMDEPGQVTHKLLEELTPKDWVARVKAEGAQVDWIAQRQARRDNPQAPIRYGHRRNDPEI
jgi:hypothetical protein